MSTPRRIFAGLPAGVLLVFTLPGIAVADAPHFRLGSLAGFAELDGTEAVTVGVSAAIGHRFGPVSIEAESSVVSARAGEPGNRTDEAVVDRLGLTARLEALRLRHGWLGERTRLALWLSAGAGRQHVRWQDDGRELTRPDATVGVGFFLDHRIQRFPRGIRHVGWHVGWQLSAARRDIPHTVARCTKRTCPQPTTSDIDRAMAVSSGVTLSW